MSREKNNDEPYILELSRSISAPLANVYKAWTDPKKLAKWWGAKGYTNPVCEITAKPEGTITIEAEGPEGIVYPMRGIFHEVVKNEKLVFSIYSHDDDRKRAALVTHHIVTFAEQDEVTTIVLTVRVVRAAPEVAQAVASMSHSWGESLDRLTILITKK
jgi:uncharacterized protein YndB with AHSA1/START domain